MSDTGDRQPPKDPTPGHDPDDLVGFASPAALAGRPRAPDPKLEPQAQPAPSPDRDLFDDAAPAPSAPLAADAPEPTPAPVVAAPVEPRPEPRPAPANAREAFEPTPPSEPAFGRRDRDPVPDAPMGIYAIYALILFAVPTLGVSAAVGLVAVLFGDAPRDDLFGSHHVYQKRTLWTAAVAAVVGAILIVVNLGVFVLFLLVGWLVIRGAWGVFLLTRGRPVPNPRGWWVG